MNDLIIIGAGPGGYVAAIRAAQLGMKVTLVEREELGGTCLNHGCIPTKALYKNAQVLSYFKKAETFGIHLDGGYTLDMDLVQQRKQSVVKTLVGGVGQLLKGNGVTVLKGSACILAPGRVEVMAADGSKGTVEASRILIATGSDSAMPPVPGMDLNGVITSREALALSSVPKRIVIVGGGVIGIEFAGIFKEFGAQVTVVELMPAILPLMDRDIAKRLARTLAKQRGIRILVDTRVERVEKAADGSLNVSIAAKDSTEQISCDCVLVATGRVSNVKGLGLDEVGVKYDRKGVKVDENYETNVKGIYAIGDVTGRVMLAHVASEEGVVAVERMMGHDRALNYDLIPAAVFTFPDIATVGLTEEQLVERNIEYRVGKSMYAGNGKALTMNDAEGIVKVLASPDSSALYGVHILGPNASDTITEAVAAMNGMFTLEEISRVIHGHPTLSEAFAEAVNSLIGCAIHTPNVQRK